MLRNIDETSVAKPPGRDRILPIGTSRRNPTTSRRSGAECWVTGTFRPADAVARSDSMARALVHRRRDRINVTPVRLTWHETADGGAGEREAAARVGAVGGAGR